MRNLKKVLSLSLALVMLLGMMVVGAGAATTYTDADQISAGKLEAVEVMSGIGVFQGSEGALDPKGMLTREMAATIVCNMLLGKTVADNLSAAAAPFTDVAASDWSAPYIAYCKNTGIVAGRGDGTFGPKDELTNLAFATIMLRALGYKDEYEGWTNEDTPWAERSAAIYTTALRAGLLTNVDMGVNEQLNRENAIQMSFNTLTADLVEYTGGTHVNMPGGGSIVINANRTVVANATSDYTQTGTYNPANDAAKTMQFCENLTVDTDGTDAAGRDANVWTYNKEVISTAAQAASLTFTGKITDKDLKGYTKTGTVKAVIDGKEADTALADVAAIKDLSGRGITVEIYLDGKDITNVFVTTETIAEVKTINARNNTVTLEVKDSSNSAVSGNIVVGEDDPCYANLAAMAEKDVVLVTVAWETNKYVVQSVSQAETIVGVVSRISNKSGSPDSVTMNGVVYEIAANCAPGVSVKANVDQTLYLSSDGYILFGKGEAPAPEVVKFAMLLDSYQTLDGNKIVNMYKLVLADGSVVDVKAEGSPKAADATNKAKVWTYTETDGVYALTEATADTASGTGDTAEANKTVALQGSIATSDRRLTTTVQNGNTSDYFSNFYASNVKFVYVSDGSVTVRDGVQRVSGIAANKGFAVVASVQGSNVVTTVFLLEAQPEGATTELVYFADNVQDGTTTVHNNSTNKDVEAKIYIGYVDGKETEIILTGTPSISANTFYRLGTDENTGAHTVSSSAYTATTGASAVKTGAIARTPVKNLYDVDSSLEVDLGSAVIVDVNNTKIGTQADLDEALKNGDTVNVAIVYDSATQAAAYVYVTGSTPAPAGAPTVKVNGVTASEISVVKDGGTVDVVITAPEGCTIKSVSTESDKFSVAAKAGVDNTWTITGGAAVDAGTNLVIVTAKTGADDTTTNVTVKVVDKIAAGSIGAIAYEAGTSINVAGDDSNTNPAKGATVTVTLTDPDATKSNVVVENSNTSDFTVTVGEVETAQDGTRTVKLTIAAVSDTASSNKTFTVKVTASTEGAATYKDSDVSTITVAVAAKPI